MPIYEYFCQDCHTVYNFFSRRVSPGKSPDCPKCGRTELPKMMSTFAAIGRAGEKGEDDPLSGLDETKMEQAFEGLMKEAGNINEEDPRQMATLMRKFSDNVGLSLGEGMEEALSRMESGEDPDQVEKEMGDLLDSDDAFSLESVKKKIKNTHSQPEKDEKLYFL